MRLILSYFKEELCLSFTVQNTFKKKSPEFNYFNKYWNLNYYIKLTLYSQNLTIHMLYIYQVSSNERVAASKQNNQSLFVYELKKSKRKNGIHVLYFICIFSLFHSFTSYPFRRFLSEKKKWKTIYGWIISSLFSKVVYIFFYIFS